MIGITSFGAYIPRTRLPLALLAGRAPRADGPEKSVAWNDEDAVTMGVAAAIHCLDGIERASVDGVLFASTTYAFREKQASALIARALDLRRDIRTADFGGSLRAGTSALRAGIDSVAAGSARCVLVIASDDRMAAPGSALEASFGDAAVAFLVGEGDAIATLTASHAIADEILDVWRSAGDPFVHSWEDRFVVQEGYLPKTAEAVEGLLAASGSNVADYDRFALYAPDARSHAALARRLGLASERVQDPLFGRVGNAGTAFAPLLLAAALESAKPGERLVVASYGDGAEALAFETGEHLEKLAERRGVAWHLAKRRAVTSYDRYLKARDLATAEWKPAAGPGLSATIHYRERDDDISLRGQQCRRCDAIQFPAQRVCETCFAKDDFESVRLSDRLGSVVTYTFDHFFPTPDPPTVVTITDVDGARIHLQLVDCTPEQTRIGLPVEFVFRRIHASGGRPNYYWKGRPAPGALPEDA